MHRSIEILAVLLFTVMGLSHLVQPRAWVRFFILLRETGEPGAFVDGFLNLFVAAFIVVYHNVWSGIPTVITVLGWCLLVKSLIRFCLPKVALRAMGRVSMERAWEFQAAGALLLALAGVVGYGVYTG